MDQRRPQLHPNEVKPKVEQAANWILSEYHEVTKDDFIMSAKYWAEMLVCVRFTVSQVSPVVGVC